MFTVDINYLAVFAAVVANMVIGSLWYSKALFGKTWIELAGISEEKMKAGGGMKKQMIGGLVAALVMAYVLAHFVQYVGAITISDATQLGFWLWLGFIAPVTAGSVFYESKSWKLWFLNNCFWLISLIVMAIILTVWTY